MKQSSECRENDAVKVSLTLIIRRNNNNHTRETISQVAEEYKKDRLTMSWNYIDKYSLIKCHIVSKFMIVFINTDKEYDSFSSYTTTYLDVLTTFIFPLHPCYTSFLVFFLNLFKWLISFKKLNYYHFTHIHQYLIDVNNLNDSSWFFHQK